MTYRPTALLQAVADCLGEQIEASPVPDVCFCGVVVGDSVVADYAGGCGDEKQGMAWVRMVSLYPAEGLNRQDESPDNCEKALGMDFEVGILRPVYTMDEYGNPPTAEQYLEASRIANEDAIVMMKAIRCCTALREQDFLVGIYQPGGQGGVMLGTWPIATIFD
jgi:hypothetical protein